LGKPNNSAHATKPKDERQFTIEFPHDKHQNVIASLRHPPRGADRARFVRASSFAEDKKPDYNNCTICHKRNASVTVLSLLPVTTDPSLLFPFKTMPHAHDACFTCHWKNQKPASDDCGGCHKPATNFVAELPPKRISAKFAHEGGKGEHIAECTTCHINITRASTLRGLTPDVPIAACTTCHKDNKKITYPNLVTIEEQFE